MKNSLEILFDSPERWRLIKMFLLNDTGKFSTADIAKKSKVNGNKVRSIVNHLIKADLIVTKTIDKKKVYFVNKEFPFLNELKNLVIKSNIFPQCESLGKIKNLGAVKLGLISGVFISYPKSKTDLLIVGENISRAKMRQLLEELEAEMGREINYSLMTLQEFKYRANMFDKFILEILNSPHEIIVNKMVNEIRQLKNVK